jgi:hypothetical protein
MASTVYGLATLASRDALWRAAAPRPTSGPAQSARVHRPTGDLALWEALVPGRCYAAPFYGREALQAFPGDSS